MYFFLSCFSLAVVGVLTDHMRKSVLSIVVGEDTDHGQSKDIDHSESKPMT